MPANYYLKIEGVEGNSKNTRHLKEIEIMSFTVPQNRQREMRPPFRVSVDNNFYFTKKMDQSSPKLLRYAAEGTHIPEAILTAEQVSATGSVQAILTIQMSDVIVASYQNRGSDEPL